MKQARQLMTVGTNGAGLYEITRQVADWVAAEKIGEGLLTLYIRHTSASLLIQENADPAVLEDLHDFFHRTAPEGPSLYRHKSEGPDDMPAHIKSALTQTQLSVPVTNGRLDLGRWQGIFVFEHRTKAHNREIVLHLLGE